MLLQPAITEAALPVATPVPTPVAKPTATTGAKPPAPTPAAIPNLSGDVLQLALVIGLIAAGASSMAKKKWPEHKVIACDTCISTWSAAVATAVWWASTGLPVVKLTVIFFGSVFLAGAAVCLVALKAVQALTKVATS